MSTTSTRYQVGAPGVWSDIADSLIAAMHLAAEHAGHPIAWGFGPQGALVEQTGTYLITELPGILDPALDPPAGDLTAEEWAAAVEHGRQVRDRYEQAQRDRLGLTAS